MERYCVDEFVGKEIAIEPKEVIIDKKVSLLYDLCMLVAKQRKQDPRESLVRKILNQCENDTQMDNVLHDVIRYDCTIDQLLQKKGIIN